MVMRLAILGSTGSIGQQTLDVVRLNPDRFEVVALAAGNNAALLAEQVREFRPALVSLDDEKRTLDVGDADLMRGREGLLACATHPDAELVVVATSGVMSIEAVLAAARLGRTIALANKEALVCAADLVLPAIRANGAELRPVDSEHSAIWQCMGSLTRPDVRKLTLTASGGPFRTCSAEELTSVTAADALKHPTWEMGRKITIDSATLVNKGLEVIEAQRLFSIPYDRIDVLVHPESIVHSLVEFADGSTLAQLGQPDMRLPIQYALTWPEHAERPGESLSLAALGALTFDEPDLARFPALGHCIAAGRAGGSNSTALCAADEVAVDAFLDGRIRFTDIPDLLAAVLDQHETIPIDSIDAIDHVLGAATQAAEAYVSLRSR